MKNINFFKHKNFKFIICLIFSILIIIFSLKFTEFFNKSYISYSEFIEKVEKNEIEKVFLSDNSYILFKETDNSKTLKTDNPKIENFKEYLLLNNIKVSENLNTDLFQSFFSILIILLIGFFIYKSQKKSHSIDFEFSKNNTDNKVFFKDIAGNEEAKENAQDIIDFLKNPEKYHEMGARVPRGIIFYGKPGTGKTLLARAIASEAGVPFYSLCGSDFVEMYVGVGAKRIRTLFKQARNHKKAVIFIDEIDAIGKKRSLNLTSSNDERENTLNALLSEISGFSQTDGIVIIGSTNRIDILDEALIRSGRFDRHVEISLPDKSARKKIIELHFKNKNFDPSICIETLAKKTVYFSGAMLESLINEATIFAIKENQNIIKQSHIDKAYLKFIAGDEKKDKSSLLEIDKKVTAFHEAGHALVTKLLDSNITISKISIIPSTKGAGGFCVNIFKEKLFYTKKDLENQIMITYAGRIAEEIIFGRDNITTGAENDIEKATKIIMDYVNKYSMNSKDILLNQKIIGISKDSLQEEYYKISTMLYKKTKNLIQDNLNLLQKLSSNLILKEVLDEKEINKILINNK